MAVMELPGAQAIYESAQRFVDAALRADDSMFTPGAAVWTSERARDIYRRVMEQADTSSDSFMAKLERQLAGAETHTIQLMAETLYVHFLIANDMGFDHKKGMTEAVLQLSGTSISIPDQLQEALKQGLANSGIAYKTYRPNQIAYLLQAIIAWKALTPDAQASALGDPWAFKEFLLSIPVNSAYAQRNALLHLIFPATFERIVSGRHKRELAAYYSNLLDNAGDDVDRQLLQIRKALEQENGAQINFYQPPFDAWRTKRPRPRRSSKLLERQGELEAEETLNELAEELLLDGSHLIAIRELLRIKKQVVFYGPPGTGKTYVARKLAAYLTGEQGTRTLVQFHPSYAYEDFIEGYRPAEIGGQPGFRLEDGPLKQIAQAATLEPESIHVLVIDEINRGNVAKVFGELYFLLEYRGETMQLQYSRESFALPENLWIIGTMNTADRSIALLDAALRRRFFFVPFFPDEPPIEGLLDRWLEENKPEMRWVAEVVDRANRRLGSRHAAIGPSHFMTPELDEEHLELIWRHAILPYLEEHFYESEEELAAFDLDALRASDADA